MVAGMVPNGGFEEELEEDEERWKVGRKEGIALEVLGSTDSLVAAEVCRVKRSIAASCWFC